MNWSYERLLQLAPGPQALEQARRLFFAKRWRVLEGNGQWLWGEYETRFGQVIQAAVRLEPPLFRCSCKSRQKPCKHSLALILLFLNRPDAWHVREEVPEWVQKLLTKADTPQEPSSKTVNKAGQEKRLALMDRGVEELERWLRDLLRQGLAQVTQQTPDIWANFAARMVDCKLGGIARRIRLCAEIQQDEDWVEPLLHELGLLYLFVRAWQRKPSLTPEQKRELLQIAGWNTRKDSLLSQSGLQDNWLVWGLTTGTEEKLTFRRTWLRGERSGRFALILDFVFGNQGFDEQWVVGSVLRGEVVYYPGQPALRAVLKNYLPSKDPYESPAGAADFEQAGNTYTTALAQSPWLHEFPFLLDQVRPLYDKEEALFYLLDKDQRMLPLMKGPAAWQLLSISGGEPLTIFGEYNGSQLRPLAVIADEGVIALSTN